MKKFFALIALALASAFLFGGELSMNDNSKLTYKTGSSNIIMSDYPDPDIIRVDDTYYMASTTMHMMPGCVILRSYNLLDWEFCTYVYDKLDSTPGQTLKDNAGVYGKGMWAASLRYNNGTFYVSFVCNDTHKSYLYTSKNIEGPWTKSNISGFYHDMSLLFDDDGKAYVTHGNTEIHLTQLNKELTAPEKGGIDKIIIRDNRDIAMLGYEGSHFYKINGKYYIFMIHWPRGGLRTEACYVSDKIDGPYTGCDVLSSDLGGWHSGVAQGGIVQSNNGKWYGILFQDHGALGRIPVLVPVSFNEEGFPVFGEAEREDGVYKEGDSQPNGNGVNERRLNQSGGDKVYNSKLSQPGGDGVYKRRLNQPGGDKVYNSKLSQPGGDGVYNSKLSQPGVNGSSPARYIAPSQVTVLDNRPGYEYSPLYSDDFTSPLWQWNHEPDLSLVRREPDSLAIKADKTVVNVAQAANTLTQRTFTEHCSTSVKLDASALNDGDVAGLCALEGLYGLIGVTKENGKYYIVTAERNPKSQNLNMNQHDTEPPVIKEKREITGPAAELCLKFSLTRQNQSVQLMYKNSNGQFERLGMATMLRFTLDHFVGVRSALFCYSTKCTGGEAVFRDFKFTID